MDVDQSRQVRHTPAVLVVAGCSTLGEEGGHQGQGKHEEGEAEKSIDDLTEVDAFSDANHVVVDGVEIQDEKQKDYRQGGKEFPLHQHLETIAYHI